MRLLARLVVAGIVVLSVVSVPGRQAFSGEPIAWTTWRADLFTRAKAEKKLVILDLEAVWCHWCHVMDRETYGDARIRRIVGDQFIAVRADQDANPDLSARYGDWGWPATIVFAPDGTEIAKLQGFTEADELLPLLEAAVADPTPGPSIDRALPVAPAQSHVLDETERKRLKAEYDESYDTENGGWGVPLKYVDADSFDLALSLAEGGDKQAEARAVQTLDRALALIDPVWGGIYQYSDRPDWSSPHYEKIMAFQAQHLRQFSQAYARWKAPKHRNAAKAIKSYLTNFLTGPEGAFHVSQNADLDHQTDGRAFYALNDRARRAKGVPRIDTSLYARENGWAISGLAAYAGAFEDEEAIEKARRAADWVKQNRGLPDGGFRHGANDRGGPFLGDTLAMGQAFLDLYAVTAERGWLADAERAAAFLAAKFQTESGGFASAAKGETAEGSLSKPAMSIEEQVPAVRFLILLGHYTGKTQYREIAERGMRHLIGATRGDGSSAAGVLLAERELARQPTHLTIVGSKREDTAKTLFTMARSLPASYRRLEWWDMSEGPLANPDIEYPELGKAAAFACSGHFCSAPTFSAAELKSALEQMAKVKAPKNAFGAGR